MCRVKNNGTFFHLKGTNDKKENLREMESLHTEPSQIVIVAPHPDDEIIGCYSVLSGEKSIVIIYSSNVEARRKEEALNLKDERSNVKAQLFQNSIPPHFHKKDINFYFPDPSTELHPDHRVLGMMGEQYARQGFDVTFYTTNMQTPYIHEIKDWKTKEALLNKVYPSQADLWKYEKKYVLFEGFCKWIF
jgi:hypothetical protein